MAKKESKLFKLGRLLREYDIETAEDLQEALKDLLGSTIKGMMEAVMENHLGYNPSAKQNVCIAEEQISRTFGQYQRAIHFSTPRRFQEGSMLQHLFLFTADLDQVGLHIPG